MVGRLVGWWWFIGCCFMKNSAMVATLVGFLLVGWVVVVGVGFGWCDWWLAWLVGATIFSGLVGGLGDAGSTGNTGGFVGICGSIGWVRWLVVWGL